MDFDSYAEKIKYQIRQRSEEKQRIQNKFANEWHKSSPEKRTEILWRMSQSNKGFGCSYSLIARDVNIISLCDNPFVDHIPYRIRSIRVNLTELARVLWSASQYYSFDDFERIIDDKKEHVSMFLENVHSDDYARGSSLNQIGSITNGLERGGGSR